MIRNGISWKENDILVDKGITITDVKIQSDLQEYEAYVCI